MRYLRRWLGWAAAWAARSVWWPLAGKAGAFALAFVALAHVGSGAAARVTGDVPMDGARRDAVETRVAAAPVARTSATASARASASCETRAPASAAWTEDGRLILNRGDVPDFEKLPRIGAKRARKIVALREKLGRFRHLRDLARIRGIGYRMLKKLEPLVVVDAPKSGKKGSRKKKR